MKKGLKVFFAVFLIILLAGCADQTTKTPIVKNTVTPAATAKATVVLPTATADIDEAAKHLRGVTVTFMHPWTGKMNDELGALIGEFNQTNEWGIQVVTEAAGSASSLSETLNSLLQNSTPPEMIAAPVAELLNLNKNSQTVADLTPYVDSKTWGLDQNTRQGYLSVFWNEDVVDGFRYGIPAQRNAKVLVYNKTWANELGFKQPPLTPNDFFVQVCAANAAMKLDKDSTNDGLGGWIIDTDALTMASWAAGFGAELSNNGKVTFNSNKTISALTYLSNMLAKGCAWISRDSAPYAYFAARQTLVYSADLQDLLKQQAAQKRAGSTDEWTVLTFPSTGAAKLLTEGPSYAVLAVMPEKRLAAWLFIRWMTSDDHQGKLIKASVTLPLSDPAIPYAVELQDSLPQWLDVVNLLTVASPTPASTDWPDAKMIWEDASWQLFKTNMTVAQIPALVKQMDLTLAELTGNPQ